MRLRGGLLGAALAVAAVTGIGAPAAGAEILSTDLSLAAAKVSCDYAPAQVFAPWGDLSWYAPIQGSSFESGSSGWSLTGKARLVSGDTNPLLRIPGNTAVEIPGGAVAKSPAVCVDATTPSMRFFVRRVAGSGSLTVTATLSGDKMVTTVTRIGATAAWAPSPVIVFPDWGLTTALKAEFAFVADPGTVYRIDDVYIDPFRCC